MSAPTAILTLRRAAGALGGAEWQHIWRHGMTVNHPALNHGGPPQVTTLPESRCPSASAEAF